MLEKNKHQNPSMDVGAANHSHVYKNKKSSEFYGCLISKKSCKKKGWSLQRNSKDLSFDR
jgi:hypothetical protein